MIMHLNCLRCGKTFDMTEDAMQEVGYTKYSYCEDCLRSGLKLLSEEDNQNSLNKIIEDFYDEQRKVREKIEKEKEGKNMKTEECSLKEIDEGEPRRKIEKGFDAECGYLPGYIPGPTNLFPITLPLTWACPWNDYFK